MLIMSPGPFPVSIRLCLDAKSWNAYTKKIGYEDPFPEDIASVSVFQVDGRISIVVHFGDDFLRLSQADRLGIIVHESTHVWQDICEHIEEAKPGHEVEANSIQWIFNWLRDQLSKEGWIK